MKFVCSSVYEDEHFPMDLSSEGKSYQGKMFVSKCIGCGRLAIYDDRGAELDDSLFSKAMRLYPSNVTINRSIPDEVREIYISALKVKNIDSDAFVLLVRKALEVICKIEGINKGNLSSKLQKLKSAKNLPDSVMEAANQLRLIGNQAAHDVERVHPLNAELIEDFFQVLLDYLFLLPAKLSFFVRLNEYQRANGRYPMLNKDGSFTLQKGKYENDS